MNLLSVLSIDKHGSRPKEAFISAALALAIAWSAFPATVGTAEAAFPGRNGLIIVPIRVDPLPQQAPPYLDDLDLFTLGPDGTGLTRLTSGPPADFDPAWSPDGTKIAFARATPFALAADIYVMNRDGSGLVNITNSPLNDDFAPEWSPDGKRIVFTSWDNWPTYILYETAVAPGGDLYIVDSDGGNLSPLVEDAGDQGLATWSPDGKWIAFSEITTQTIDLIRPDGSGRRSLTPRGAFGHTPYKADWSPDGKWIAFGAAGGSDQDIWVIRSDGKQLANLTAASGVDDQYGTWSPDGRQMAFISNRQSGWRLYRMDADGRNVRELIDIELVGGDYSRPDWGPRP
ncbi:MAG: hypothetical protein ABR505_05220 [Actinomycetota bacterium]